MRAAPLALFAAGLLAACSFTPAGTGEPFDGGDDGDGGGDGPDAGCQDYCFGDELVTCAAGGGQNPPVACPLGCSSTGGAHCRALVPSNGATAADLDGVTGDLVISTGFVFYLDTNDGSIVSALRSSPAITSAVRGPGTGVLSGIGFRVDDSSGAEIAIFSLRSLSIQPSDTVVRSGLLRASGARPLIILVGGAVDVSGAIDVGAGLDDSLAGCQRCGGPGGGDGGDILALGGTGDGVGCAPGGHGNYYSGSGNHETGGGGGGFGSPGAAGGSSGASVGGTASAIAACPDETLVPLRGGSGGGRGSYDANNMLGGVSGGGGGGALQLTSLTSIEVRASADIYAGGAGGPGSLTDYGGGGGGSGGALLLEAPTITLAGVITANGGGGGSGREANRGENGNRAAQRASGGSGSGIGSNDGRGGLGSIGNGANQNATTGNGGVDGTGGGGGGAGLIRVNLVGTPSIQGAVISPTHTVGAATLE